VKQIWKDVVLGDVFESITNGVNCDQKSNSGRHLITRIETISKGVVNLERIGRADLNEKELSKYRLTQNDILFSHINSPIHVGKTALFEIDEEVYHGVNLLRIRTIDDVDPKFLRYFLLQLYTSGFWRTVAKQSVNQASVNQKDISAVPFSYPSLELQREIVEKLDSTFSEIDLIEGNLGISDEKTTQLLQSLLNASFAHSTEGSEASNHAAEQKFVMSKTHNSYKLSEVTEIITDGSHNPPKGVEQSNYLMLSSRNVFNDDINLEKVRYLTRNDFEQEDKRTSLKDLDVLLTIVGTIGRAAVFRSDLGKITLQRSVAVIRPIKSKLDSRFLMYSLQSMLSTLLSESRGVAQQGFYLDQLRNLNLFVPSTEKQHEIVEKLDSSFAEIELLKAQIEIKKDYAMALRQSLLSSAFTQEGAVA
jgi:type I restriction enzyme S subunit